MDSNPAPSVSAASAIIRNQPPRSNAKKRTATEVLASKTLPAESCPTPSVLATLIAKRKQPPRKKAKKTEVEAKKTNKTSCNADVCLEPKSPDWVRCDKKSCARWFHQKGVFGLQTR
ncbi:Uncharacterized protein APZ42_001887 [Daphnia magna]|uniref:Uncharacterized protein n=2 Tax=Daphnia magna TaxID=35525 RepID=A0A162C6H2_9CRUS|nr:Uncharacterized protein APZ42_001887 [Daphnia magna]